MANCAYAANNCRAVTAATSVWRRRSLASGQGTVVVAVVAVRVVEMAGYPVIHMIAVRHRFMAAPWPMDVPRLMPATTMVGGAGVWVLTRYLDHMLVDMTFVGVVKVTIVQVVSMAAMTYGGVSTTWAVLVRVIGVGGGGARRHETTSFSYLDTSGAAAPFRARANLNCSSVGR